LSSEVDGRGLRVEDARSDGKGDREGGCLDQEETAHETLRKTKLGALA
jgi:hypothetical protein